MLFRSGNRVKNIVKELCGEKIEVVHYSDDPVEFIKNALSPAKVISVTLDPSGQKNCQVIVPDNQLSLAIGNKGQSAKLAAKLTGWKIDIKPESYLASLPKPQGEPETASQENAGDVILEEPQPAESSEPETTV